MAELTKDTNGFIEIKSNKLSRGGVFDYLGSEIGAPEPNRIYNVFRPPKELAEPECIQSFKLQPWIIDHKMLGKDYDYPAEAKGIHGTIGEDVYFDPEDGWLKGNIKIWSNTLEEEIEEGKNELSLGYKCVYDFDEAGTFEGKRYNVVQRRIRGNHLASVDVSRTDVAVMDSSSMDMAMKITIDKLRKTNVDAKTVKKAAAKTTSEAESDVKNPGVGQDQEKSFAEVASMLTEIIPKLDGLTKAIGMDQKPSSEKKTDTKKDGYDKDMDDDESEKETETEDEEGKVKDKKGGNREGMDQETQVLVNRAVKNAVKPLLTEISDIKKAQSGLDRKTLIQSMAEKDELASTLSQFVGAFDHAAMTTEDVAKYGIEKLKVPAPEGSELTTLRGYLHRRQPGTAAPLYASGQDGAESSSNPISEYIRGAKK